jgi:hypothetical protein
LRVFKARRVGAIPLAPLGRQHAHHPSNAAQADLEIPASSTFDKGIPESRKGNAPKRPGKIMAGRMMIPSSRRHDSALNDSARPLPLADLEIPASFKCNKGIPESRKGNASKRPGKTIAGKMMIPSFRRHDSALPDFARPLSFADLEIPASFTFNKGIPESRKWNAPKRPGKIMAGKMMIPSSPRYDSALDDSARPLRSCLPGFLIQ